MKVCFVAGARPNFMKVAPLIRAARARRTVEPVLVHTGQHYDEGMSETFFRDLDIPAPDHHLNVGSGSHAVQTARVMVAFEEVCLSCRPDLVVVVGDVNSTMACAVTARKLGIRVAHVEAGLRSRDMSMPEEVNRIVADAVSDLLFVTEPSGMENLRQEGRAGAGAHLVGNVMIDSLHYSLRKLPPRADPGTAAPYAVATLHRPSNVDDPVKLAELLDGLVHVGRTLPVFFPAHPRTRAAIERYGLGARLEAASTERHGLGARLVAGGVHVGPPLSYLEFLALWRDAALVVTDSGGIQEETTALGVPCFTLRENTERPITVEEGTNTVLGASGPALMTAFDEFMAGRNRKTGRVPHLWDGRAAERILDVIVASLSAGA